MTRPAKATYKTYFFVQKNKVVFHDVVTHPLYIHVTYNWGKKVFKSYYFDLFIRPVYQQVEMTLDQVIEQDNELMTVVHQRIHKNFSVDTFWESYFVLGRDLIHEMDESFKDFLINFFMDEGLSRYAGIVRAVSDRLPSFELIEAFRTTLKKDLMDKLQEHAGLYHPAYFPLFDFVKKMFPNKLLCFPVYRWQDEQLRGEFEKFVCAWYPRYQYNEIERYLTKLSRSRKKKNR